MSIKDKIFQLRDMGKTYSEIQKELGCSKGTISYHLGKGQKEKSGLRYRNYREKVREYVREIKESSPCTDCGISYPYYVMEFDHLRDKANTVANITHSGSFENVKKEIKKCELVCANCHKTRTWQRMQF